MGLRPLPRFPACGSDGCSRTRRTVPGPRSRPAFRSSRPERAPLRTLCRERACGLSFRAGIFRGRKLRRRFEKRYLRPFRLAEDRFCKERFSPDFPATERPGKVPLGSFAPPMYLGSVRCERSRRIFCRRCRKKPSLAFLVCRRSFPPVAGKESLRSGNRIVGGAGVSWGARRSRFGMKPGTVLSFAGLCGGRTANASDAVVMGKSGTAGRKMAAVKRRDMYARGPCRRTKKLSE